MTTKPIGANSGDDVVNADFAANWIQYLKNNWIALKSDPVTRKLIYRRPVYAKDVASFLGLDYRIEADAAERLIESVIATGTPAFAEPLEDDGFVDNPGVEIKESEVKAIFAKARAHLQQLEQERHDEEQATLQQEQAAKRAQVQNLWVDGLSRVSKSFAAAQRPAFISLVGVMRSGLTPLRPTQISGTIKALVPEVSPKKGFFASLVSKKPEAGPSADEIEHGWLEAGAPMEEKSFLDFLASRGFDRDRAASALRESMLDPNVAPYTSEKAFEMLLELAERVKDADEDKLEEQFDLIRSMTDEDEDDE
jgi:hypothetical protein